MAYGITEETIEAFGDLIFDLSLNRQTRLGDPVRLLDMAEVKRQRPGTGLSDAEIAGVVGLTVEQTRFIRVVVERRRFRTDQYRKLFGLGTGKRWREERYRDRGAAQQLGEDALRLRSAMRFKPGEVRKFIEAGWWRDETLTGVLAAHAGAAPERPALIAEGGPISYGALEERSARLAGALSELGIGRGDVVAVQLPNSPAFVVSYLAIAALGAVMSPVHMAYREAEIKSQLSHCRARGFICAAADDTIIGLKETLPALEHIIRLGGSVAGALSFDELEAVGRRFDPPVAPAGADPLLLLYTSGTISEPKAVPFSGQMILANTRLSAPELGVTSADLVLCAAPFSHAYGLFALHLAMTMGAATLLVPAFKPDDFAALIESARPSVLFAAPAHIAACAAQGLLARHDFSSLRLAVLSGSPLAADLAHEIDRRMPGGSVVQLWGMTETMAALFTRPGDPVEIAATSAGRPSPGTEVRIVDGSGAEAGTGTEGELQVRGCTIFAGYLGNDRENQSAFTPGGWFRTGDLAAMDAAGNVSITGRIKDIINRGGVKFNPRDVEDLLDGHEKIEASAIVPMPDPVLGEKACCFVTLISGADIGLEEICSYLMGHGIARHKLPERLEIIDELPLTPTRKIIKARLVPKGGW